MDASLFNCGLCEFCTKVNHYITIPRQTAYSQYRSTTIALTAPSLNCLFCDRINEHLRANGHHQHWLSVTDEEEPRCKVFVRHSSLRDEYGLACKIDLHINQLSIYLSIWADEGPTLRSRKRCKPITFTYKITGSRAAKFIISRPPIIKDDSERTVELIQKWLFVCSETHDCDNCPYSGEFINEASLPTRILKIGVKNEQPVVRLITTHGIKGRYCALSYCWGRPEKMPLRSTTSNLQKHSQKFDWNELPKTFQDSIILCGKLGIEYLWIDSLCIIQNDPADWSKEASRMGSLYKNAFLVIFASGSSDSTEGLFIGDRPNPSSFTLPFSGIKDHTQTNTEQPDELRDAAEIYHLMFAPSTETARPLHGPLAQRGWALQEWHLARRRVSFMPGGMIWNCTRQPHDERGYSLDPGLYSTLSWASFLRDFTSRRLTYHTDRLKAVEGVANEMKKGGREGYNSGTWADNFISDVLWIPLQQSPEKDALLDVPSWSWASTGSPKSWLLSAYDTRYVPMSTTRITDPSSFVVSGQFLKADTIEPCIHDCCITALELSTKQRGIWHTVDTTRMTFLRQVLDASYYGKPSFDLRRLLLEFRATNLVRGVALMDSISSSMDQDNVSCIILARIDLNESEPDTESDSKYPAFPVVHQDKASCIDFAFFNVATAYHFGLIVQTVDEERNTFQRVGVALLFSCDTELDATEIEINLV